MTKSKMANRYSPEVPQPAGSEFQDALAQYGQVARLRHDRGEARQRGLGRQSLFHHQRGQPGRGAGRQPHGRIVPQSVGIVMVAPTLRGQQDRGAQEGRQVMHHVSLSPGIVEPVPHRGYDAAGLKDFSQEHGAGVSGQSIRPALDPQGLVEHRYDRL